VNLQGDDALCGFFAELDEAFGNLGGLGGGHRRLVGLDAFAKLGDLGFDRRVVLLAGRELLASELQELEALVVDRVQQLPLALAGVLQALLVELERVDVRLDADLDAPRGLVRVDVVERGVRRLARLL
jgi:hypothetical protein